MYDEPVLLANTNISVQLNLRPFEVYTNETNLTLETRLLDSHEVMFY